MNEKLITSLSFVYGDEAAGNLSRELEQLMEKWGSRIPSTGQQEQASVPADQSDTVMICYGDSIKSGNESPLRVLGSFARKRLNGVVSGIHILPFSPYSSDEGFSVIDYRQVNPDLGHWDDVEDIGRNFRLMADLVLNHCSAQSTWFQKFCDGTTPYNNYFIKVPEGTDLSGVFRPRALPLLHSFDMAGEQCSVWTTFSADQVDLNFANPAVFLEFVDILLSYVSRKVNMIRLDAIGFLWKEIGTSCIHHPKTHEIVKIFRMILEELAPRVMLITETNVPHKENISYFGTGSDEAQMVYQFPLPPLTVDAFMREDAQVLTQWALGLDTSSKNHCFFNFLASHDGIGLLPAKGLLEPDQIESMVKKIKERGGRVSYKSTPEEPVPYEMNISYLDAVAESSLEVDMRAKKFLASQAIMLALAGVPGIYIHSLVGSVSWQEGVELTGVNRSINREKLSLHELEKELDNANSLRGKIFSGFRRMLRVRRSHPAFHPVAKQEILSLNEKIFAVLRGDADTGRILCLQSVCSKAIEIGTAWADRNHQDRNHQDTLLKLNGGEKVRLENGTLHMAPWEVLWLEI